MGDDILLYAETGSLWTDRSVVGAATAGVGLALVLLALLALLTLRRRGRTTPALGALVLGAVGTLVGAALYLSTVGYGVQYDTSDRHGAAVTEAFTATHGLPASVVSSESREGGRWTTLRVDLGGATHACVVTDLTEQNTAPVVLQPGESVEGPQDSRQVEQRQRDAVRWAREHAAVAAVVAGCYPSDETGWYDVTQMERDGRHPSATRDARAWWLTR